MREGDGDKLKIVREHEGCRAVLEADLTTCEFRIIVEDEVEGKKEIRL